MSNSRSSMSASIAGRIALTIAIAGAIGGCSNKGAGPHAKPLPSGQSCKSIHSELRRMDARGVPTKVEAVNAGRKVSASSRKLANRYNELLNDYLAARCHT